MTKKVSVQVSYVPLSQISKHPKNPRTITEDDLSALCNSIKEDPLYFETRPIICSNRTGSLVIIAGEKRFISAEKLGFKEVPVAVIPNLSEDDEIRILFKDNGSFGQWDKVALREWDFDLSQLKGWGVEIEFSTDDFPLSEINEHDKTAIRNENFEQAASLNYLHYANYKIPLSDIETEKLNSAIQQYMELNGTLIGFVNSIFPTNE